MEDKVVNSITEEALQDTNTIALLLGGSRSDNCANPDSDYDFYQILTDAYFRERQKLGEPEMTVIANTEAISNTKYYALSQMIPVSQRFDWEMYGLSVAKILVDKTGELSQELQSIVYKPEAKAHEEVYTWLGAYINALHRSIKAWRRKDELGGRLHASDSIGFLVKVLFSLEKRWTPYNDRLKYKLNELASQGWKPDWLAQTFVEILKTGNPKLQLELEAKVESLLQERGYASAFEGWAQGAVEEVKNYQEQKGFEKK